MKSPRTFGVWVAVVFFFASIPVALGAAGHIILGQSLTTGNIMVGVGTPTAVG